MRTQRYDKRLDILALSGSFPDDYLPYTREYYHRREPYLIWNEAGRSRNRKWWGTWRHRCWKTGLPCVFSLAFTLLLGVIAASIYLGWMTHLRNTSKSDDGMIFSEIERTPYFTGFDNSTPAKPSSFTLDGSTTPSTISTFSFEITAVNATTKPTTKHSNALTTQTNSSIILNNNSTAIPRDTNITTVYNNSTDSPIGIVSVSKPEEPVRNSNNHRSNKTVLLRFGSWRPLMYYKTDSANPSQNDKTFTSSKSPVNLEYTTIPSSGPSTTQFIFDNHAQRLNKSLSEVKFVAGYAIHESKDHKIEFKATSPIMTLIQIPSTTVSPVPFKPLNSRPIINNSNLTGTFKIVNLENKTLTELPEISVEASFAFKPDPNRKGVGQVTVIEDKDISNIPERKPKETSTELTVGASLFIRNDRRHSSSPTVQNGNPVLRKPSLPRIPITHSSSPFSLEVKPNPPINVRGTNNDQHYVPLPNDTVKRLLEIKESRLMDLSGQSSIPKIISQYAPYNDGTFNPTKLNDFSSNYKVLSSDKNRHRTPTKEPNPLVTPFSGSTNFIDTDEPDTTQPTNWVQVTGSYQNNVEVTNKEEDTNKASNVKICQRDEFSCGDGTCVSVSALCDRRKDCPGAIDEINCSCADYLRTKVFKTKICDGVIDCWDFSDETECAWCTNSSYVCPGAKMCISKEKVCDGVPDCPGAEDEVRCVRLKTGKDSNSHHHGEGILEVRKNGRWGKLCVSKLPFSWTLTELGKNTCHLLSYRGVVSTEQIKENLLEKEGTQSYYSMEVIDIEHLVGSSKNLLKTDCPGKDLLKVSCKSLECGLRPLNLGFRRRIVGGQSSALGSWPWQVALYKEGEFQCGGVIIKDKWLLSAAHCFYHSQESHWTARMGLLRRGGEIRSPFEQQTTITHIIIHPMYIDRGFINDIVLLRTDKPIGFGEHLRPVCLPTIPERVRQWEGRLCTAIGWGKLFEIGRIFPDTLQEVQLPVISTEECRKRTTLLPLYKITDNMFCAGFDRGGRDACLGDSGGPLMCQREDGRWSLAGVTSNGDGCGRPGRPGVYTKVVNYLEWIHYVTENETISTPPVSAVCKGHRCSVGRCLPQKKICDGVMDCWDNSDEASC